MSNNKTKGRQELLASIFHFLDEIECHEAKDVGVNVKRIITDDSCAFDAFKMSFEQDNGSFAIYFIIKFHNQYNGQTTYRIMDEVGGRVRRLKILEIDELLSY